GYHDSLPLDGIDDRRGAWLQSLAVRFAPWMVRNTIDFPMDARRFIESGDPFPLFIDSFDASRARPRLLGTQTIDFAALKDHPCPAGGEATDTTPDCRLLRLLDELAPDHLAPPKVPRPGFDLWRVLYFDFPGQDPHSWAAEFEGPVHEVISRKY